MELMLLKENSSELTQEASEWDFEVDGGPTEVVKQMTKIMFLYDGIGLAAPQCGLLKRIFIMGTPHDLITCINPKIVNTSDDLELYQEGCLSFPNLWLKVRRPTVINVQYQTITGTVVENTFDGLKARVFLHEYDHLDGITFDQKVSNLTLKMAKEKRIKQKKGCRRKN